MKFQLTRPAWGVTGLVENWLNDLKISTHTPCVGRDKIHFIIMRMVGTFQLTRPAWGVTI